MSVDTENGTRQDQRADKNTVSHDIGSMIQGVQGKCITNKATRSPTRITPFSKEKGAALHALLTTHEPQLDVIPWEVPFF